MNNYGARLLLESRFVGVNFCYANQHSSRYACTQRETFSLSYFLNALVSPYPVAPVPASHHAMWIIVK
jgi:hypothetical protein